MPQNTGSVSTPGKPWEVKYCSGRQTFFTLRSATSSKPDLLAFMEPGEPGALDGADMDEGILAATVQVNEAEALGC